MSRTRKPLPRHFSAPRTCGGKHCYDTRQHAEQVIAEKAIVQPELDLTTYRCTQCHSWHLTRVKYDRHFSDFFQKPEL